ncbi:MAG: hypothetical protein AABY86_04630, partial [Bdellovibrionota bacterium]
ISYVAVSRFDSVWFAKLVNAFSLGLSTLGIIVTVFILFYKQFLPMISISTCIFAFLILIANIFFTIFGKGTITLRLAQYTAAFLMIWYHLASMVALPILPERVREQLIGTNSSIRIGVVYRKPYFVSELLNRDIESLSQIQGDNELRSTNYDYLIMPLPTTISLSNYQIHDSWNVWKRGLRMKEIYDRLINNKLDELQESYTLFSRKI